MDYLGVVLKEGIEWRVLKALGLVRVRVQRKKNHNCMKLSIQDHHV